MKANPLDVYEEMPPDMRRYITNYGWHFTKRAYEYAVSLMYKDDGNGNEKPVRGYTKDEVDNLLNKYGIKLNTKIMYDYVFVATMCLADYYGSSITDEVHLLKYVKDTVDDADASGETTFRRWYATMIGNGMPIDWSDIW